MKSYLAIYTKKPFLNRPIQTFVDVSRRFHRSQSSNSSMLSNPICFTNARLQWKRSCWCFRSHFLCRTVFRLDYTVPITFPDEMILDIDAFGSSVLFWIVSELRWLDCPWGVYFDLSTSSVELRSGAGKDFILMRGKAPNTVPWHIPATFSIFTA